MFALFLDRKNRVLLTRVSGILRHEEMLAQSIAARKIDASEGPLRGLLDFSDVEAVDIPLDMIKQLGKGQQNIANQVRVYLIPSNDHQFGLARLFGTYQSLSGNVEPQIVRTMAQAYDVLQITDPDFVPLEPDLRDLTAF